MDEPEPVAKGVVTEWMTGLRKVESPVSPPKAVFPVLPGGSGETKLRADFVGKRTRSLHHAGVDFHLLRFAVDLPQQIINLRDGGRNIADDQGIRTNVGDDVAAAGQESLQGSHQVFAWA